MFARALRPPHDDTKVQYVPYGRQVEFAERLGVGAIQGATKSFEGMTVEEIKRLDQRLTKNWLAIVSRVQPTSSVLCDETFANQRGPVTIWWPASSLARQTHLFDIRTLRDEYVKSVNPSGEVPSLKTATGDLVNFDEFRTMFELFNYFSDHLFSVFDIFWIFLAYCSRINFLALFVLAAGDNLLDPQEGKLMSTVTDDDRHDKMFIAILTKIKERKCQHAGVLILESSVCVCDKLVLSLWLHNPTFRVCYFWNHSCKNPPTTFNGFVPGILHKPEVFCYVPRLSLQLRGNHYRVRDLGWVLWRDLPDVQTKTDPKWCRQSQSHEIGNEEVQWCDPWVAGLKVRNMSSDCKLFAAPYWSH